MPKTALSPDAAVYPRRVRPVCLKCGSRDCHKSGRPGGKQRYKCARCGYEFVRNTPRGKSDRDKLLALYLYSFGLPMDATCKIVGSVPATVKKWIGGLSEDFSRQPELVARDDNDVVVLPELPRLPGTEPEGKEYLLIRHRLPNGSCAYSLVPKPLEVLKRRPGRPRRARAEEREKLRVSA